MYSVQHWKVDISTNMSITSAISNISCRVVRVNIVVEKSSVILLCFSHIRLNPLSNKTRNLSRISSNACFRIWIADYRWDDSTLFIIIASQTHICWNFLVRQVIYSWRWRKAYKQTLVGEGKAIENVKRSWNYRWTGDGDDIFRLLVTVLYRLSWSLLKK